MFGKQTKLNGKCTIFASFHIVTQILLKPDLTLTGTGKERVEELQYFGNTSFNDCPLPNAETIGSIIRGLEFQYSSILEKEAKSKEAGKQVNVHCTCVFYQIIPQITTPAEKKIKNPEEVN